MAGRKRKVTKTSALSGSSSEDEKPSKSKIKKEDTMDVKNFIPGRNINQQHSNSQNKRTISGVDSNQSSLKRFKSSKSPNMMADTMDEQDYGAGRNMNQQHSNSKKRAIDDFDSNQSSPKHFKSEKALNMMANMGYKEGKGLGKEGQGRTKPVELQTVRGRRGLGLVMEGLEPGTVDWKFEEEVVEVEEQVEWIPLFEINIVDVEQLQKWLKVGKKKLTIDDETNFINPSILAGVLSSKTMLDRLQDRELFRARSRSNPFETIKKGIFINRAAMKMANIDAILNFELTNPRTQDGETVVDSKSLLYFADVCAGPGGFSEYVLWKKNWKAKGFGFTLKGDCDFKLNDFSAGPPESFEAFYGVKNDGDIFCPLNVKSFIEYVHSNTMGNGVHFMMADGGFSVEGQENIQEILSRQLYLSQALVAIGIIRPGGHFLCKLFDIFTPFSVGLVYLMYSCFEMVSILKPNTSRPANSERYLICKWKKEDTSVIFEHLSNCHQQMWSWSNESKPSQEKLDILELVPLHVLKNPEQPFFNYVLESNNSNGNRQIQNLKKIVAFYRDETLIEIRQFEVRLNCLNYWDVPERKPKVTMSSNPTMKLHELFNRPNAEGFVNQPEKEIKKSTLESDFRSPYSWRFTAVGGGINKRNRGFYLSLGGNRNFRYNGPDWQMVDVKFSLSNNTLVYGEIVYELQGIMPEQLKIATFHIIDGLTLGGEDISSLSFDERHERCVLFAEAMNKTATVGMACVRAKKFVRMEDTAEFISRLSYRAVKGEGRRESLVCPIDLDNEESAVIQPTGLLFLKNTRDPWLVAMSRSARKHYWFNTHTNKSDFIAPASSYADFLYTMSNRIIWCWDKDTNLSSVDHSEDPRMSERVHVQTVIQHIDTVFKCGVK